MSSLKWVLLSDSCTEYMDQFIKKKKKITFEFIIFIFNNTTFCLYQNLLTAADISLIIMAVLQLCVSITVTALSITALLNKPAEVRLTAGFWWSDFCLQYN